jgi:hypothetical protein
MKQAMSDVMTAPATQRAPEQGPEGWLRGWDEGRRATLHAVNAGPVHITQSLEGHQGPQAAGPRHGRGELACSQQHTVVVQPGRDVR